MKSWFALLMVLSSSSGCILLDDPMPTGYGPPPAWTTQSTVEPPQGSCLSTVGNISMSQTQEPELLHAK